MKRSHTALGAVTALFIFAPTLALAEGWFIKTIAYHETSTADCMKKSEDAFRGIAKDIQRGKDVMYGYDIGGRAAHDAIIICQRANGAGRKDINEITVQLVIYDRIWSKKSRKRNKELRDQIVKRYLASMENE